LSTVLDSVLPPLYFLFILLGVPAYLVCGGGTKRLPASGWAQVFCVHDGYSMYVNNIDLSSNPAIDMNNVDNPASLCIIGAGREQYGSAPLVYGPHFAEYERMKPANVY